LGFGRRVAHPALFEVGGVQPRALSAAPVVSLVQDFYGFPIFTVDFEVAHVAFVVGDGVDPFTLRALPLFLRRRHRRVAGLQFTLREES